MFERLRITLIVFSFAVSVLAGGIDRERVEPASRVVECPRTSVPEHRAHCRGAQIRLLEVAWDCIAGRQSKTVYIEDSQS